MEEALEAWRVHVNQVWWSRVTAVTASSPPSKHSRESIGQSEQDIPLAVYHTATTDQAAAIMVMLK